ncbi:MAG: peptide-methionine (R)-S-oxide reductase [Pirellulaceae bacterium]|jgi:peptide-methionine (R)-S-oxide reductase
MNNSPINKVLFFNTFIHLSLLAAAAVMFGGCTPSPGPISNTTSPSTSPSTIPNTTVGLQQAPATAINSDGDIKTQPAGDKANPDFGVVAKEDLPQTAADWQKRLTQMQYYVMRQEGTEQARTGELWDSKKKGYYICAGCNAPLFHSKTKFESGTGWPSFWQPAPGNLVEERADFTFGGYRTEVHCKNCGGHLGHVFDDGPAPTGLRYCINSASLKLFEHKDESDAGSDAQPRGQ